MSSIRILADMNISPITVKALRADGWTAQRVSTPLSGDVSDMAILAHAAETNQVVCTQDLDFSSMGHHSVRQSRASETRADIDHPIRRHHPDSRRDYYCPEPLSERAEQWLRELRPPTIS
jgi:hypothetical protein